LAKTKEEKVATNIKEFINKELLPDIDVQQKFALKRDYLISHVEEELLPDEHSIVKWTSFLPPLRPFKLKPKYIQNVTEEFKEALSISLTSETIDNRQRDNILTLESKIIYFSLEIQSKIQNIVKTKALLLSSIAGDPFLENACCDEKNTADNSIKYFYEIDSEIQMYNNYVVDLTNVLDDVNALNIAPFLFCNLNTKKIFPPGNDIYSEITIYRTFINVCKFHSIVPLREELKVLCKEKPNNLFMTDSIDEKIKKLKDAGKNYTNEMLLQLIQLKDKHNIIPFTHNNNSTQIKDVLMSLANTTCVSASSCVQNIISDDLLKLLEHMLKGDEENKDDLLNYILPANKQLKKNIVDFLIQNNNSLKKTERNNIKSFIDELMDWNDEGQAIQFMKNQITNLLFIYPNIILNKIDYSKVRIAKYVGLSLFHSNKITDFINKFYEELCKYYDNDIISTILSNIKQRGTNLQLLIEKSSLSSFIDIETELLLYIHCFLLTLMEYINLIENMPLLEKREKGKVYDETENMYEPPEILRDNKGIKIQISKLLSDFIFIINEQKELINLDMKSINDILFKVRLTEINLFTDSIKKMTDENKEIDTLQKINKLGRWNKGLQKGLTQYVKETYDDEIEQTELFVNTERKLLKNRKNTGMIDLDIDDYLEEEARDNEIDGEDNNLNNLPDDFGDGQDIYGDGGEEEDYIEE
jgi:hypothetical protein